MGRAIVKTRMTPARTKSRFRWRARRDDRIRLGHHDVPAPRGRCAAQNHRPSSPCRIRTPYPKWASCSHTPQRRAVSLTGATTSAIAGFIVLSSGSHFVSASLRPDALMAKTQPDAVAIGHFERSCRSQNSTSSRPFGPHSGVPTCSPSP